MKIKISVLICMCRIVGSVGNLSHTWYLLILIIVVIQRCPGLVMYTYFVTSILFIIVLL